MTAIAIVGGCISALGGWMLLAGRRAQRICEEAAPKIAAARLAATPEVAHRILDEVDAMMVEAERCLKPWRRLR